MERTLVYKQYVSSGSVSQRAAWFCFVLAALDVVAWSSLSGSSCAVRVAVFVSCGCDALFCHVSAFGHDRPVCTCVLQAQSWLADGGLGAGFDLRESVRQLSWAELS
jgi:hypothetical protein